LSRHGSSIARRAFGLAAALVTAAACGKKGPPLAPLIPIPAAIEQIDATRIGNHVYVTLTVPSANVDRFSPADIDRIEVYGYTGRSAPPRARWVEFGTLVATVPVAPPPAPAPARDEAAATTEPVVRAPQQGAQVTVVDTLTAEELVQGKVGNVELGTGNVERGTGNVERGTGNVEVGTGNVEVGTQKVEAPLRRFYTAYPWNPRGRPGPPGANAELPLASLPEPPPSVSVTYDHRAVRLAWEPSGGLIGFLLERPLPEEPLPPELEELVAAADPTGSGLAAATPPGGPVLYNVYRTTSPDPFAPPPDTAADEPWNSRPPAPINPAPLAAFEFLDAISFNEERCYTVRTVHGTGADPRIGVASAPACVTPVDTFAPVPPAGLATVASEGAINLIWEPNLEPDLAGYLVLRGEAPGDTLQPLNPAPIVEARYRDPAVTPGVRYVYAIVAVDNRFPVPNLSAPSTPQEETAR
jgi:hypothetical protein